MCRATAYSPFGGRRQTRKAWRANWQRPEFRAWVYRSMADADERLAQGETSKPMTPEALRAYLRIDELRAEVAAGSGN